MFSGHATTLRTSAVVAALLFALVGCGSDDSDTTATDTSSSTAPSESASASASESPSEAASGSPSVSPSESPGVTLTDPPVELSPCADVWVEGTKLPQGYAGCTDGSGAAVTAEQRYCEFGKPLFTYGDSFYAVENGPVNKTAKPLAKDKAYQTALRKCGG